MMNSFTSSWVTANPFHKLFFAIKRSFLRVKPVLHVLFALINKSEALIIFAEDDPDEREIFLETVEALLPSVKVQIAHDGKDLMKQLLKKDTKAPDAVFLDLNMPFKNGYECLEEIRKHESLKQLPVIIYSSSTSPKSIEKAFTLGATYYLPKPDSIIQLKKLMKKLFSHDCPEPANPVKERFVLSAAPLRW